ncbi:MAG: hypothetical protein WCD18_21925 [Thermosynechococcaceae cyanobacterium]
MKTSSTTIFSCIAAGLLLSAFSSQALAQTEVSPDKPLSPEALEALCKESPSDARCASKEGAMTPQTPASTEPAPAAPTGGGTPEGTAPAPTGTGTSTTPEGTTPAPAGTGTPGIPGVPTP